MADANPLFSNSFDGTGHPTWDPWPYFSVISGNPSLASQPVVDGYGHGIASRHHAVRWRLRSTSLPGRSDYQAQVTAKWKNPGGSGRSCALLVRFKDYNNWIGARLDSSTPGIAPTLKLYKCVGGTETQLGSTYTGSPISESALYAGCPIRISVEDQDNGDTKVEVYTDPDGASDRGDVRISYTGDLGALRGNHGVGIEIGQHCKGTDIIFDDLQVWDLADDAAGATPPAPGTGWQVQLDNTLYTLAEMEALDPPIELMQCGRRIGLSPGDEPTFVVKGSFSDTGIIRPNLPVKIYHDGDVRFTGKIVRGTQNATPEESSTWKAKSFLWGALQVLLEEDDGTASLYFNVTDTESDYYNSDRQSMTLGDIIEFLFDRYLDKLRFYGAVPSSGNAYISSQLTPLDAVIPDLTLSGNFVAAIQACLRYMPTFEVRGDPDSLKWEFIDTTSASADNIALTSEHATLTVEPDPESCYTAVLFRGAKKEQGDPITLTGADAAWSKGQQSTWEKNKKYKGKLPAADILASGNYSLPLPAGVPKGTSSWVDIPASAGLGVDDFRGAVAMISGRSQTYWVLGNTGTRIYLNIAFASLPHSPDTINLNLMHPDAIAELSAQGVGSAYFLPPAQIDGCGGPAYGMGIKAKGWCGAATVSTQGDDGSTSTQKYAYHVSTLSAAQAEAFGACAVLKTSEPVLPSIGLINKLPAAGSMPPQICETGGYNPGNVQIEVNVPSYEEEAPRLRYPAEDGVFEGDAYDAWQVERELVIDMPDFTDSSQATGLQAAAEAMHALYSQKQYLFNIDLATPWRAQPGQWAASGTSRFFEVGEVSVTLSSSKRTTGFESTPLPVHSVSWDIRGNKTSISAGSLAGWLNIDPLSMTKQFTERDAMKKIGQSLKQLEDFRNRFLEKAADQVTAKQGGDIYGCEVVVEDTNIRKVVNINDKMEDEQEWLNHVAIKGMVEDSLFNGPEQSFPGNRVEVPGLDEDEAQQVVDGPVLGSHADPRIPFQGPDGSVNSDRSKYGGLIGTENADTGNSPDMFYRRGGLAFRKTPNMYGTTGGGTGMQFATIDDQGNPGSWQTFQTPLDLPHARTPLSMLGHGSTQHQLLQRSQELAKALGRVEDFLGELQAPGETSTEYPDGAPADLASSIRADGFSSFFTLVPESMEDPGGPVWHGPHTQNGADSELYWRVMAPEMVVAQVTKVGGGAGANGGEWDWYLGKYGEYEFMAAGYCVHKQSHPFEMQESVTTPGTTVPATGSHQSNSYGFSEGITLNGTTMNMASEGGSVITMPDGVRGRPLIWCTVEEDPGGAPVPPGATYSFDLYYEYKASAWTPGSPAVGGSLTADGANQAVGRFAGPADAVPPGLRAVGSATVYNPAAGSAGNVGMNLMGWGVEVAVVEGGYFIRNREQPITVSDEVLTNQPWDHEVSSLSDTWSLEIGKVISEATSIGDDWTIELNPPIASQEACGIGDGWTIQLNP